MTPMALYRHVRDKDDILEGVADALLADAGLPEPSAPGADYLTELATSLRALLKRHPSILTLFTRRPLITPMAVARPNGASAVLRELGTRMRMPSACTPPSTPTPLASVPSSAPAKETMLP